MGNCKYGTKTEQVQYKNVLKRCSIILIGCTMTATLITSHCCFSCIYKTELCFLVAPASWCKCYSVCFKQLKDTISTCIKHFNIQFEVCSSMTSDLILCEIVALLSKVAHDLLVNIDRCA